MAWTPNTQALVTSRRKQAAEDVEPLSMEVKEVAAMHSAERQKWLTDALRGTRDGKVDLTALFDVLAHRRFAQNLGKKAGRRMRDQILEHAGQFSGKQRKILKSDLWPMEAQFGGEDFKRQATAPVEEEEEADIGQEPEDDQKRKVAFSMGGGGSGEPEPPPPSKVEVPASPSQFASTAPAVVRPVPAPPAKPRSTLVSAVFAGSEEDLDVAGRETLALLREKQRKKQGKDEDDGDAGSSRARSRSQGAADPRRRGREEDQPRRLEQPRRPNIPLPEPLRTGGDREARASLQDVQGPLAHHASAAPLNRRRTASDKNPAHDGLDDIKAELLRERGLGHAGHRVHRDRGVGRDRDRDRADWGADRGRADPRGSDRDPAPHAADRRGDRARPHSRDY